MLGKDIHLGDIIDGWRVYSIQQAKSAARNPPDNIVMMMKLELTTPGLLVPNREIKTAWYWADEDVE